MIEQIIKHQKYLESLYEKYKWNYPMEVKENDL